MKTAVRLDFVETSTCPGRHMYRRFSVHLFVVQVDLSTAAPWRIKGLVENILQVRTPPRGKCTSNGVKRPWREMTRSNAVEEVRVKGRVTVTGAGSDEKGCKKKCRERSGEEIVWRSFCGQMARSYHSS